MNTKIKIPKFLFHKPKGSTKVDRLSFEDWVRRIRQEEEATPAEGKFFKDYLEIILSDGEYELQIPDDWEASDKARVRALYRAVEKAYKASLVYEADIATEAEEQKVESAKRGQLIVVGAEKGRAMAHMAANHLVKDIATAMKGKFVIDGVEMKLAKGAKPTEKDFSEVLSCLVNLKGAASNAADAAGFYMVDAIRLAGEAGFDGDEILQQVSDEFGVTKFTVMSAQRTGETWPPDKRMVGPDGKLLSMTVHAEIGNYAGGIKDRKKLDALIEKVAKGKPVEVISPSGEKLKVSKPYSAREVRAMAQEASGKTPPTPPTKPKSESGKDANFLYIGVDAEGNEALWVHNDLSMVACESPEVTVVDLATLTKLDKRGMPAYPLKDLPDIWFPVAVNPATPKQKEPKAPKPEKPKADPPKKVEPAVSPSIPD